MKLNFRSMLLGIVWVLEGAAVGFGAILPGVSGGTLCAAFGIYRPLIETISHPRTCLKQYAPMLLLFLLGAAAGFAGLSGIAAWMLARDTALVTCIFVGLVLGTFPSLWQDAGKEGRNGHAILSLLLSFAGMLLLLWLLRTELSLTIRPGIGGYLLCGLLWGLSFIVPGLSSSSLMLFFGLYQPMLEGISAFDPAVLLPMGIGMAVCTLLLAKAVGRLYRRAYAAVSHGVVGIAAASAVMLLPPPEGGAGAILLHLLALSGGAAVSFLLTRLCSRLAAAANNDKGEPDHDPESIL